MPKKKSYLGPVGATGRGFEKITFRDFNGTECSLQQSSAAVYEQPGSSAVWLGCEDADPQVFVPGKSWQPVQMPPEYIADTRAHLDRKQVQALIHHLEAWLETGSFELNSKPR